MLAEEFKNFLPNLSSTEYKYNTGTSFSARNTHSTFFDSVAESKVISIFKGPNNGTSVDHDGIQIKSVK